MRNWKFNSEDKSITRENIIRLLDYNPETGIFLWKDDRQCIRAGSVAGFTERKGYRSIKVLNRTFKAHRLAWFIFYGEWPKDQIDHINRDKSDNRIANLRESSNSSNQWNSGVYSNSTTGYRGVSWHKKSQKYWARIGHQGRRIDIGLFDCPHEAALAFNDAAIKLRGEFAALNEVSIG